MCINSADVPSSLSWMNSLEGLNPAQTQWRTVLERGAHQRLLKSNFNEVQYALPPSEIFLPRDLKIHVDNVIEMMGSVGFKCRKLRLTSA